MANSSSYLITALGVVAAVAAFYTGRSQSRTVYVQSERVVYKPYTQAEEQKHHQQLIRQERRQYSQDARVIDQALLVWAKDHDWGRGHIGHYRYGVLPSQEEVSNGCLNNYDKRHLAESYAQQGILSLASVDRVAIAYGPGAGTNTLSSDPGKFVAARMQAKDKQVAVRLYGDGHIMPGWLEAVTKRPLPKPSQRQKEPRQLPSATPKGRGVFTPISATRPERVY